MFESFFPPNVKKLKARRDVQGLIRALSHKDPVIPLDAIYALASIGGPQAAEGLIQAFKDSIHPDIAAKLLGEMGEARAVGPLLASLAEGKRIYHVIEALGILGDARAVQTLMDIAAEDRETAYSRYEAVVALRRLGDKQAVPSLVAALKTDHPDIQAAAAEALNALIPDEASGVIAEAQGTEAIEKEKLESSSSEKKNFEMQAVRQYLRYLAANWWSSQPETRSTALCDSCGAADIPRNGGYLIGSYLWCETCYVNKNVETQIERDPTRSLGPGVYEAALEMFGGEPR